MSYDELSVYGRLRKIGKCGPVSMFRRLCQKWGPEMPPTTVAELLLFFFRGQEVLFLLLDQPAQDHRADPGLPRRKLHSRRQPV